MVLEGWQIQYRQERVSYTYHIHVMLFIATVTNYQKCTP